jgi:hypothetical protein
VQEQLSILEQGVVLRATPAVLCCAGVCAAKWQMLSGQTKNMFITKTGIDIGALPVILDVRVCTGYKREVDGSIRKEYAKELAPYPLQVRGPAAECAQLLCILPPQNMLFTNL